MRATTPTRHARPYTYMTVRDSAVPCRVGRVFETHRALAQPGGSRRLDPPYDRNDCEITHADLAFPGCRFQQLAQKSGTASPPAMVDRSMKISRLMSVVMLR